MITKEFTRKNKEKCKKNKSGYRYVTQKMIELQCDDCLVMHYRTLKHYKKMKLNEYFNKDYCNSCWRPILNNRQEFKESLSAGVRRAYLKNGEEIKEKISKTLKDRKINVGNRNAMKRPEVRAKVSKTRTEMMKDPAERLKYRQGSIDAHKRGCYIGINTNNKTKWHKYLHSDGTEYSVQGTWELKYIAWLDQHNVNFECHKGRLPYTDDDNVDRNYYPDFYLPDTDEYIDVKADYWYNQQRRKFEILEETYPNRIKILNKRHLNALGIKL